MSDKSNEHISGWRDGSVEKMLAAQGSDSELGAQNTRITRHGGPSFNLNTRGMGRGR